MAWTLGITRRMVVRGVLCTIAVAVASIGVHAQNVSYTFSTIAGAGPGNSDGIGQAARFSQPAGIAIDSTGTLYVNDRSNRSVRKISAGAVVTTLASGFLYPSDIAVGSDGSIYVADLVGNAIKKISAAGSLTVFASSSADGFGSPTAIAVGGSGTVFLSDGWRIFTITPAGVSSFLAGGPGGGGTDGVGAQAQFNNANGLAPDGQGNVYVADSGNHTIRKIAPGGVVTTVAGLAQTPGSADGSGDSARFNSPSRLTVSASGTIYVTDTGNHTIRAVSPGGVVTTLAGSPGLVGSGDGPVAAARFSYPTGIVADAAGSLYVADTGNHTVRKISAGVVTTFAGVAAPSGTLSSFSLPRGIAIDADQRLTIADTNHHTVQHLTSRGVVTAIAGTTSISGSSDDYTGEPLWVSAIAFDGAGTLHVAGGEVIRKITPDGSVSTLAGKPYESGSADGTGSTARFYGPSALVVDAAGDVFVADSSNHTIRKVTPAGVVTTLAGLAGAVGYVDGTGHAARFGGLSGIALDSAGNLYVIDIYNSDVNADIRIRKITTSGVVTTLPRSGTPLREPRGLAISPSGTFYIADERNRTINAMTPNGVVTILAGTADAFGNVDGTGGEARFMFPVGLTVDAAGMIYVADRGSGSIRKVTPTGVVTTVTDSTGAVVQFSWPVGVAVSANGTLYVGDNGGAYVGDNGGGLVSITTVGLVKIFAGPTGDGLARFSSPRQIASGGRLLYVADTGNHTIRVGTPRSGALRPAFTTFAGVAGASGTSDGTGSAARFNSPSGVAVDSAGNIYVADTGNHTVRKITAGGIVTTLAGLAGSSGSADGSGSSARFSSPSAIAVDRSGTLYVADTGNHAIRTITAAGVVTTLAGTPGSSGSADGAAAVARFRSPAGIAVDGSNTVYVADTGNHTLRAITQAGVVSTIGGLPATSGIADGVGDGARFNAPVGITVDSAGAVYIADTGNSLVRVGVLGSPVAPTITLQPVSQTGRRSQAIQFTVSGTGNPSPGYQWQWQSKSDGQNWFDLYDQYGLYSGAWAESTQTEGAQRATLTVTGSVAANGTNLRAVLTNAGGSTTSNVVTLTVHSISLSPTGLTFGSRQSNGAFSSVTPAQRVTVVYTGPETLQWTATTSAPWLRISRGSGTGAGTFDVAVVDPGNLVGYDTLRATIRVSDSALELSAIVDVNLNFGLFGSVPFGTFDTPLQGATGVSGSIAVTGWALDDIAVERVEIWRDLVSGETTPPVNAPSHPGHGKVFIANALFVDGARPDVVNKYEQHGYGYYGYRGIPLASRAGWGYLLLTWGLWNQGNGPYTLYAFAFDQEGNSTTLGTKTISVDNANATKPFGALDVPTYGETKSGSFQNFGWALTPSANAVDPRSCTIANGNVFMGIDSGALTPVSYGDNRTDVAGFFPGFSNGSSAGGHYLLDTATLSNGVHQIGWYVVDNCGRADGIGSRFFTVLNGSSVTAADALRSVRLEPDLGDGPPKGGHHVSDDQVPDAVRSVRLQPDPVGAGPLRVRRTIGEWTDVQPNAAGVHVVAIDQSERIEVRLPALDDGLYAGAQVVNGDRRALPLGSSLDAETGIFYWQPAAGFLGSFLLEFARVGSVRLQPDPAGPPKGGHYVPPDVVRVRVVVGPPMRMAIDTPAAGVVPQQALVVAGWAIDLAATDGSGIDTVHVWAYPVARGGDPIFLGVADIGDARPDVAAIYGPQFERSSYSLAAPPLAPGTYDIVVYPHRAATGTFDGAQVVRVTIP